MSHTSWLKRGRGYLIGAAIAGWLGLMASAFFLLVRHEQTPGSASTPIAARLPEELDFRPTPGRAVLLMFVHPRCPCSRASLGELEKLASRAPASCDICLVFYKPVQAPDDWVKTSLYAEAQRLGWPTCVDPGGVLAERIGATTSGHVLIYNAHRRLVFSGGITGSRGHWGDNESEETALNVLTHDLPRVPSRPVFGCSLQRPAQRRGSTENPTLAQGPHVH